MELFIGHDNVKDARIFGGKGLIFLNKLGLLLIIHFSEGYRFS